MWGNRLPFAVADHKCQTLRWPAGDRPLPAAPARPGRLARHPREGKRAAHDSQQHSQHEPAEVRGNKRRERGEHGENRIEDPLRRVEPQQKRTEDEHDRHHIAGQSLSAQVHHDGDRRPFGQQDLDAAEERDQAAPERPGAPPPAETQAAPPKPAAAWWTSRPCRRDLTGGHSSRIRGRGLTGLGRLLGPSRRVLRRGIVLGMGGVVASSHCR
jgi:hypothetical protein